MNESYGPFPMLALAAAVAGCFGGLTGPQDDPSIGAPAAAG